MCLIGVNKLGAQSRVRSLYDLWYKSALAPQQNRGAKIFGRLTRTGVVG